IVVTEKIMKSLKNVTPTEVIEKAAEEVVLAGETAPEVAAVPVDAEIVKAEDAEAVIEAEAVAKSEESEEPIEAVEKSEDAEESEASEEAVEKSEAEAEAPVESVEKASTSVRLNLEAWADSWDGSPEALKEIFGSLIEEIENMKSVLKSYEDASVEETVEKSEDEETPVEEAVEKTAEVEAESTESIEKSGTEDETEAITKALNDTLSGLLDEKLGGVVATLSGFEKRLAEIENAE